MRATIDNTIMGDNIKYLVFIYIIDNNRCDNDKENNDNVDYNNGNIYQEWNS